MGYAFGFDWPRSVLFLYIYMTFVIILFMQSHQLFVWFWYSLILAYYSICHCYTIDRFHSFLVFHFSFVILVTIRQFTYMKDPLGVWSKDFFSLPRVVA